MGWRRLTAYPLVALTALAFAFLLASQLRLELVPSSNRVARNDALVRTVRRLEQVNRSERARIESLRARIEGLEAAAARRSSADAAVAAQLDELRAEAGLTRLHGPGDTVHLANGNPLPSGEGASAYLVTFEDIEDVVNLLFASGAEGIAVNGQRLTPMSSFEGANGEIVVDQGPPLQAPFSIVAVGNRSQMEQALDDGSTLGDLRNRQRRYQLQLSWGGDPDLSLPQFDGSLTVGYAHAL